MTTLQYPHPDLTDSIVLLRPWSMADLGCVEEAAEDARIVAGTTIPNPYSDEAGRAFIERQWSRRTSGEGLALAIVDEASGDAVGQVVLLFRRQPGIAGVGYWVVKRARSRGFATRAVELISTWALERTDLARIEALAETGNVQSRRVLERAGFLQEGLLRSHLYSSTGPVDALMYSIVPEDLEYYSTVGKG